MFLVPNFKKVEERNVIRFSNKFEHRSLDDKDRMTNNTIQRLKIHGQISICISRPGFSNRWHAV